MIVNSPPASQTTLVAALAGLFADVHAHARVSRDWLSNALDSHAREIGAYVTALKARGMDDGDSEEEQDAARLTLARFVVQLSKIMLFEETVAQSLLAWSASLFAPLQTPKTARFDWSLVHKALLMGNSYAACTLLESNFNCKLTTPVGTLVRSIQTMPRPNAVGFSASRHGSWRESCAQYTDASRLCMYFDMDPDDHANTAESVSICFAILAAKLDTIADLASDLFGDYAYVWVLVVSAYGYYKNPVCTNTHIGTVLDEVRSLGRYSVPSSDRKTAMDVESDETGFDHLDEEEETDPFAYAVAALMELDVDSAVLKYMPHIDFTTTVHLADVLNLLAKLDVEEGVDGFVYFGGEDAFRVLQVAAQGGDEDEEDDEENANKELAKIGVRDKLVLDYARSLEESFHWIAAMYLKHLCLNGLEVTKSIAKKSLVKLLSGLGVAAKSGSVERKVMSYARSAGIEEKVARIVYKTHADDYVKRGRVGKAVTRYVDAGYLERAEVVCETILEAFLSSGKESKKPQRWSQSTLTMTIEQLPARSCECVRRAALLQKLAYLRKMYVSKVRAECAGETGAIIVELLTHGLAPRRIWGNLLVDALPLLESEDGVIFHVQQTFDLLRCLQEILDMKYGWDGTGTGVGDWGGSKEPRSAAPVTVDVLRLALSRNLARAMMVPR